MLAGLEEYARRDGDNFLLANVVSFRCLFDLEVGRVASARARLAETIVLLGASGYPEDHFSLVALRAGLRGWTGAPAIDAKEAAIAIDACRSATFGAGVDLWQRAELLGYLAIGDFSSAFDAARQLLDADPEPAACVLADLVEAAVHAKELSTAATLRDQLVRRSQLLDTPLGAGLRELVEAALADDPEPHYERAIHQLARADAPMYTGRAHLQFGEWLRRRRRRTEATTHLERAAHLFGTQNAAAWSARAARELTPLGIATVAPHHQAVPLTPQEEAIANLAGRGATNQEIADHLFLSASTVDYHLRKVFRKLDLTSRRQLAAALHH
ncbi:helix-turn-helix transcriptional regulator [Nocardia yamanashiensis]|uniref:helix-turn-helix transcriptional regulator n=1 Tax=Nocardia yamanashiensis TaxID=209247 RepID=UPI001E3A2066|nr:helix-turn-helix transcriptional regulator [Nocardia yamanashiensis]UGT44094.1 helix-turn-helix transcriptional regulator [Nocardia yamanashiensis]